MNFPGFKKALHFSEAEKFKLFTKDNLESQLRTLNDMEVLLPHLICEDLWLKISYNDAKFCKIKHCHLTVKVTMRKKKLIE